MTANWIHGQECPGCAAEAYARHKRHIEHLDQAVIITVAILLSTLILVSAFVLPVGVTP